MFQAALRSITYANSSDNPTTAPRTVTFFVLDSAPTGSFPATSQVAVAAVDDAPVNTVPGPQITPGQHPEDLLDGERQRDQRSRRGCRRRHTSGDARPGRRRHRPG